MKIAENIESELLPIATISVIRGLALGNMLPEYNEVLNYWTQYTTNKTGRLRDKIKLDVDEAFANLTYAFEEYIAQLSMYRGVDYLMVNLVSLDLDDECVIVRFEYE